MQWIALTVTLALWGLTWPQILPADADLPPCHMMLLIGLSGGWTVLEFVKARWAKERQKALAGRCPQCGYDLTGNVSGICPECRRVLPLSSPADTQRSA